MKVRPKSDYTNSDMSKYATLTNKEYYVYGIHSNIYDSKLTAILLPDNLAYPVLVGFQYLDVVDASIENLWQVAKFDKDITQPCLVISFPEILNQEYFIKLHDADLNTSEELAIFRRIQSKFDDNFNKVSHNQFKHSQII